MNPEDKRRLENELTVMGLPGLDDPALLQAMADVVNGYPFPAERVDFFCDMLNECEGARRREMYEAMRPRLAFDVPALDACEGRIAAKAERMIRPRGLPRQNADELPAKTLHLECFGCKTRSAFEGLTVADCMGAAHKAGWGRGPVAGHEFCAQCRLAAMLPYRVGPALTRRHSNA